MFLFADCGAHSRWRRWRGGFHRVDAVEGWWTLPVKSGEGEEDVHSSAATVVAGHYEESGHQLGKRSDARGEEVCPNSEEESSGLDCKSSQALRLENSRLCIEILYSFSMIADIAAKTVKFMKN